MTVRRKAKKQHDGKAEFWAARVASCEQGLVRTDRYGDDDHGSLSRADASGQRPS